MDAPSTEVYLFLFNPQVEVLDSQLAIINLPDTEKYYWAFDPAGIDQLTHEIAEDIGLPTPKFSTELYCLYLREEDNNLIRDFHAARGFDPESQDVTIAMGYPLIDIEAMKRSAQEASLHSTILCFPDDLGSLLANVPWTAKMKTLMMGYITPLPSADSQNHFPPNYSSCRMQWGSQSLLPVVYFINALTTISTSHTTELENLSCLLLTLCTTSETIFC
jgi:hypothetical protein